MLLKTKAIVLSKLKYRDNDLIVKCYTQQKGVVSYLLRGVFKSKKGSSKAAYYQMLSQLEVEQTYKTNHTLHYINEVKVAYAYKSLHTNILKTAIVMFLSEVLSSVLKEEEQNKELFDYLETTLQWLDLQSEFSNFHLLFLLELTKHLGFYPDTSDVNQRYFNLNNGLFQPNKQDVYSISGENLDILQQILLVDFESLEAVKLNAKQRQSFLSMLLLYYELHLGTFNKPKSLQIFNQVFH